uniref:Carboxylic ester hydrolase n=1 Tax=Steinernema glaseri TaxID=37863 RepID=A0A1I7Y569_9BILA
MVFIYGGAFELGSSALYGYKNISENFVSQGIVFVTLNYRLSAFGFFSTGDHHMPGNLGLWDQAAGLHFLQEVISDFGGNPQKVTVSGESAGAASVSALTFSPHSNKLFQQAIVMSGSIHCPWAKSERVVDVSKELAAAIGCDGESKDIVFCMKAKSVDDIMKGIEIIGPTHDHLFPYKFHPRFDGEFFTVDFETALKEAPKIPIIIGVTEKEGGMMSTNADFPALFTFGISPEKWQSYSAKELKEFISKKTLKEGDPKELKDKLIEFYVERSMEGKDQMDWRDYLERFTLLGSDLHYVFPVYEEAMDKIAVDIPVYLYVEEYNNQEPQAHLPVKGPFHGNELFYLFGTTFLTPPTLTDADRVFKANLLEGFISFAKTGKPSVQNKTWTPVTKEHTDRYMSFAPESQMKEKFMVDSINFWKENMAKKDISHSEL